MLDSQSARRFAIQWVDAWNAHDLDRVLQLYHDDFEMRSPYIASIAGVAGGVLQGKAAIRDYWSKALSLLPDLHFELREVLVGVDSVVLYYRGHKGDAAEHFQFDKEGKVVRAAAHYASA